MSVVARKLLVYKIDFGVSRSVFRNTYFEKHPYLKIGAFETHPFGWSLVDEILDRQEPSADRIKVLKGGRIDPECYTEEFLDIGIRRRRILKPNLYGLMAEGASLVLNRSELVSRQVEAVCMEVGRFVGTQTTVNVYASMSEMPATNVHWDTHDVFIVQVVGRKRWRVYEPTFYLPLSSQTSDGHKADVPDNPIFDHVLEEGSILYVPRGWWHRVEPVEDSDTIHLTVAIHTPLVLDFLIWACADVLTKRSEFRRALLGDADDPIRVTEALEAIRLELDSNEVLERFYDRSQNRERSSDRFDINRLLRSDHQALLDTSNVSINSKGRLRVRRGQAIINGVDVKMAGLGGRVLAALGTQASLSVEQLGELTGSPLSELKSIIASLRIAELVRVENSSDLNSDNAESF